MHAWPLYVHNNSFIAVPGSPLRYAGHIYIYPATCLGLKLEVSYRGALSRSRVGGIANKQKLLVLNKVHVSLLDIS